MKAGPRRRIAWLAKAALAVFVAAGAGLAFIAWSGVYSVAASRGHWTIVEWVLTFGMRNSVKTHSFGIEAPALDDIDLITLGAGHFHGGCAYCHGAPGTPISPIAASMLPSPPDLTVAMRAWREKELFWIVKHGIKYTGMPAWPTQKRDDEVWAVVAFLKRLPTLTEASYGEIALGGIRIPPQSGRELATSEGTSEAVSACARCHGGAARGPSSRLVPILHGQPAEFLGQALRDYASGQRESGIMQPVASDLSADETGRVATFYARLSPPKVAAPTLPDDAVARGARLAAEGDPANGVPGCQSCHDTAALPIFPRLAGQNAAYAANRLKLWRDGLTAGTDTDALMAPIAKTLSDRQIDDVTTYYATQQGRGGTAQ